MALLRTLVSKEKRRYVDHGYNLDLTYITSRIIAMGYPSPATEGIYRNPQEQVVKFFDEFHKNAYKIYNLCSERKYDPEIFHGSAARYPFDDHNCPPIETIPLFLKDADDFLNANPDNVISIHCKAGKGRTGLFICIYLLHSKICSTADEAMDFYGVARTKNGKGLTIPSQRRYVYYWEEVERLGRMPPKQPLRFTRMRFSVVPNISVGGGCQPYVIVKCGDKKWTSKPKKEGKNLRKFTAKEDGTVDLDLSAFDICVQDDVKVEVVNRGVRKTKMFHFWINTNFIKDGAVRIAKSGLDGAVGDKKHKIYPEDMFIDLSFDKLPAPSADAPSATSSLQ